MLTATRGALVAGLAGSAIVPLTLFRQSSLRSYALAGVLADCWPAGRGAGRAPVQLGPNGIDCERGYGRSRYEDFAGRMRLWSFGLQAFPQRPLLGAGAGAYGAAVEPYFQQRRPTRQSPQLRGRVARRTRDCRPGPLCWHFRRLRMDHLSFTTTLRDTLGCAPSHVAGRWNERQPGGPENHVGVVRIGLGTKWPGENGHGACCDNRGNTGAEATQQARCNTGRMQPELHHRLQESRSILVS